MRTGAPVSRASVTMPGISLAWCPRKRTSTARALSLSSGGASIEIVTTSLARSAEAASAATSTRPGHHPVPEPPLERGHPGRVLVLPAPDRGDRDAAAVQHGQGAVVRAKVGAAENRSLATGQRGFQVLPALDLDQPPQRPGPVPQPRHVDRLAGGEAEPVTGRLPRRH